MAVVLSPMWVVWAMIDMAEHGSDFRKWQLYDVFSK